MSSFWKRLGLIILIIACLWNITVKLVNKISFDNAIDSAKAYIQASKENKTDNNKTSVKNNLQKK